MTGGRDSVTQVNARLRHGMVVLSGWTLAGVGVLMTGNQVGGVVFRGSSNPGMAE